MHVGVSYITCCNPSKIVSTGILSIHKISLIFAFLDCHFHEASSYRVCLTTAAAEVAARQQQQQQREQQQQQQQQRQ